MHPIAPQRAAEAHSVTSPAAVLCGSAARPPPVAGAVVGTATDPAAASTAPNPSLRMDPELGLVVLEFRNLQGEAAATIPTRRELDAYRRAVRTGEPSPKP